METEQIRIRLTPMPHGLVSVAIVRANYQPGKKPRLELVYDAWLEPDDVAGHLQLWISHAVHLGYEGPSGANVTGIAGRPLRPPH